MRNSEYRNMRDSYMARVWEARYFWLHLALADLRSRWRRSFFGILWTIIQPLVTTLMLAWVFGKIFQIDIAEYAPYILSGMVIWEFVIACALNGSLSFVQADAYIKQCRHPLAIYTLRAVLSNLIVLLFASIGLIGWVLVVMPRNFGWTWLAALTIIPILILIAWPLASLLAYIAVRFRDLPNALGLILQAMWFVSPIYFEANTFRKGNLHVLVDYNPIYHLLQIVRAPLLHGEWPSSANYLYCVGVIVSLACAAWAVGRSAEAKVIFYL
jgi:lipopolysaccharide transport system permease protein